MQQRIEQYQIGGAKLRRAILGLSESDVGARPGPGAWSIQELVIHLQDSEAVAIDRMRRVIAEDDPPLLAFDENRFVERLQCDAQSLEDAVATIDISRRQMARVLAKLTASEFQRRGNHSEAGPLSLEQLLDRTNDHLEHHLRYLVQKRERLGKPVALG